MKKIILALSLLIIVSTSCNKLQITPTSTSEQSIETLKLINAKYSETTKKTRTFKQWCAAGAADVGGCWAGAWAGGKIGAWFGPEGAGAGAVVGGVIVGAAASYGAYGMIYHGGSTGGNPNPIFTLENPSQNPFDVTVGQRHNYMLDQLIKNNQSNGSMYSPAMLNNNEKIFWDGKTDMVIDAYKQANSITAIQDVSNYVTNNISDDKITSITTQYFSGLNSIETLTNAIDMTRDYETYVIGNLNLSSEDKSVLLEGFSVARYSLTYWYNK